jgi:energy-coupling factor transporter ATP-binding protein EcfA2
MEPKLIREYHVFLASPNDMETEREEVRRFFDRYNRHTASRWEVRFTVVDYENYSTIGIGRPQQLITDQTLTKFKNSLVLIVGIMGQRFGSPTGTTDSGTEEEFNWALNSYLANGFPEIKWFFRRIDIFQAPSDFAQIEAAVEQWKKVRSFQDRLRNNNPPVFYSTFSDISDFRDKMQDDLSLWLYGDDRPWSISGERRVAPKIADLPIEYYQSLVEQFESLDIAGIDNDRAVDIPLSDVYVRLRVIRDEDLEVSSGELTDDDETGEMDIHAALGRYRHLVIVGDPGSGKSTFLKYIALILSRAQTEGAPGLATSKLNLAPPLPIPFFVSLWDLSDFIKGSDQVNERVVENFILSRLAESGLTLSIDNLNEMLSLGSCCVLLDGLDEVPTENGRALISRLVERFVKRFSDNRFVITSRGRGYTGDAILKGDFIRCDIQDFDASDRRAFLQNWFAALLGIEREKVLEEDSSAQVEFDALRSSIETKDRIRMLAVNPLLMTVIAIVHWNRKRLPDQRVDLYDECVDVLLGQRKTAERITRSYGSEVMRPTSEDLVQYDRAWTRKRFSEIALKILEHGADEINRESVVRLLMPRFIDRGAANNEQAQIEAMTFLDRQELRSGLLVSRKSQSFRFVHLTFQEYLAAWNLANQAMQDVQPIIADHLRDPQWFEPLQLLGGELAKTSDEKLDQYFEYLLDHLGNRISQQAPIIALCANILRDVKGVADITPETRNKYRTALRGTLAAFQPYSGVSAKNQLEVLLALSPLGSSVKEHLVQATKSSYFQVRSQALSILSTHLSDDDLFEDMSHVMNDRSQETIRVYLSTLFERDSNRAVRFLNSQRWFSSKACNAISTALALHIDEVGKQDILSIAKRLLDTVGWYEVYSALFYIAPKTTIHDELHELIYSRLVEGNETLVREKALTVFGYLFSGLDSTWRTIKQLAREDPEQRIRISALNLISSFKNQVPDSFEIVADRAEMDTAAEVRSSAMEAVSSRYGGLEQTWSLINRLALTDEVEDNRRRCLLLLAHHALRNDREAKKLLTRDLDGMAPFLDPTRPIDAQWVEHCSSKLNKPINEIWQAYEQLSKVFPLNLSY